MGELVGLDIIYFATNIPLCACLGIFIIFRTVKYRIFNITWNGIILLMYSLYFLLLLLNSFNIIIGVWNILLEILFFSIFLAVIISTKITFYKGRSKLFFIVLFLAMIVTCIFSSTMVIYSTGPYIEINNEYDRYRYFLDYIVAGPISVLPGIISCWREFKKNRQEHPIIGRRFLIYSTSLISAIASLVFNFIGNVNAMLYNVFVYISGFTVIYFMISMYLVWISPEKVLHDKVFVKNTTQPGELTHPSGETIITSIGIYHVIESLGTKLASMIEKTPQACMGLILLSIERALGPDGTNRLNLAKLPMVFEKNLREQLVSLGIEDSDRTIIAMKKYLAENYASYSFSLY